MELPGQLSLLDTPEGEKVREIQDTMEAKHEAFIEKLRRLCYVPGMQVTTDWVWDRMSRWKLELPEGMSPNALGSFFSAWDKAEPTGEWERSKRPGAHGNLLRVWRLK